MTEDPNAIALERNLALEAVRVTEATALAVSRRLGCGDEREVDEVAIGAMHTVLNTLSVNGTVVIGEGEDSPLLYAGETVGGGAETGPTIEVALDPLEGATICAKGGHNALAVVAFTQNGHFLKTPDVYMDKIAVGAGLPPGVVDLDATPRENVLALAAARRVEPRELLVCILDRPRHEELIAEVREAGARVTLIGDGDVSGVIATCIPKAGVDLYIGSGGAPEGVLAAAALACIGGQMQGRLLFRNESERAAARRFGLLDLSRKYDMAEMAGGNVMFAATGITDGPMLRGVRHKKGFATTYSLVLRSRSGTVRYVKAQHNIARKAALGWFVG